MVKGLEDAMRWLVDIDLAVSPRVQRDATPLPEAADDDDDSSERLIGQVASAMQLRRSQHRWRQWAACAGADPNLFHPERPESGEDDPHAHEARAICRVCPVVGACLEQALTVNEKRGLWGGLSDRGRRRLRPVFVERAHDFDADCEDVGCRWCVAMRAHLSRLESGERQQTNGAHASHGIRSTYARGCRCSACVFSASSTGQALARAGQDPRVWWAALGWLGSKETGRVVTARCVVDALVAA